MNRCRRNWLGALIGAAASLFGLPHAAGAVDYGYHRGHNCPRCGRQQLVIYRRGPGPYHTHRCGSTTWYH